MRQLRDLFCGDLVVSDILRTFADTNDRGVEQW